MLLHVDYSAVLVDGMMISMAVVRIALHLEHRFALMVDDLLPMLSMVSPVSVERVASERLATFLVQRIAD